MLGEVESRTECYQSNVGNLIKHNVLKSKLMVFVSRINFLLKIAIIDVIFEDPTYTSY